MSLRAKKYFWTAIYIVLLLVGPSTVLINTPLGSLSGDLSFINFLQRVSGLLLFTLLATQIVLGSFMSKWIQIVGSKVFSLHITQGVVIYALALFHPLLYLSVIFKLTSYFSDVLKAALPSFSSQEDIYLTYAKTAVILLTLTVGTAYFRTKPVFRKWWKLFHYANYLIFYLVFLHMRIGSDIMTPPFLWLSWVFLGVVSLSLFSRVLPLFYKKVKPGEKAVQKA